jgi:hypothetical protein
MHDRRAVGIAGDRLEDAGATLGAGLGGAFAQPLVEDLAVDHADEPALDRHVDFAGARRHHSGGVDMGDEQRVRDREIADQTGRDRAAAGFDPARPIQQQHASALAREIGRRRRARRPAADHRHRVGHRRRRRRGGCVRSGVVARLHHVFILRLRRRRGRRGPAAAAAFGPRPAG